MISREIGWSNLNNVTFGVIQQVNKIQKQVCCNCNISTTTTTSTTLLLRNFDVTADWSLSVPAVTSPATFKTFLESGEDGDGNGNNLTGVVITDFLLVGNRLRCNVSSTGGSDLGFAYMGVTDVTSFGNLQMDQWLYLYSNNISSVDNTSWPIGVEDGIDLGDNNITSFDNVTWPSTLNGYLGLYDNAIISFNPVTPLPNTLNDLDLGNCQLTTVDNIVWPSDLEYLYLGDNQIVTFDPNNTLPSGLIYIGLSDNQIVNFDPTIALPNSLEELDLNRNQIVTFNPTLPLPNSLQFLFFYSNQMTTVGYTNSEPWANAMSIIPGRGGIYFFGNPNSVSGTNLETILIAKGWTVAV
jgi:Leucine-rich repeat (LRR) protein